MSELTMESTWMIFRLEQTIINMVERLGGWMTDAEKSAIAELLSIHNARK